MLSMRTSGADCEMPLSTPSSASAGRSPNGNGVPSPRYPPLAGLRPSTATASRVTAPTSFAAYPPGTRVLVRRERPHPGAQLDLFETRDGWRYTCFATDTTNGQHAWLDARHRAHARVEDRIRCGKDTGLGRFPSRQFNVNTAWLACVLTAIDLLAWTRTLLLADTPTLARAEPKTLRYRLLHVAARLTRTARRLHLRIDKTWRWADHLVAAFTRLQALPQPLR